ncbi:hypothetical protein RvY_05764 [Ramazzottius varieornatus]|uniref:Uncharacterized protein n=1 Tax=Ramazzottius varieornatus TaxID=947166 RepID=A0A1D1UWN5_RAMVA|nr:hypothetical protein RvY_05764 [Ramazzottius varieornatus]
MVGGSNLHESCAAELVAMSGAELLWLSSVFFSTSGTWRLFDNFIGIASRWHTNGEARKLAELPTESDA